MKPFTFFNKKYALLVILLFATSASSFQNVLGFYDLKSAMQVSTSGIIDATIVYSNFSNKDDDSSYKWNDSWSILTSIYLNASAIIHFSTRKTSDDITVFKDGVSLQRISDVHLAHFNGSISMVS